MKRLIFSVLALTLLAYVGAEDEVKVKFDPDHTFPTRSAKRITPVPIGVNTSICYKYVGCFNSYPPFDNTGGVLPNPPEKVGTIFLLYTPTEKTAAQQLDYKDRGVSLKRSDFNPLYPVKFVIHGFTNSERSKWVHQLKDALLTTGPLNVVIVGWEDGASLPDYPKAVANTRLVAKQIQMLIGLMVDQGMDLSRVHLIGHSLGAHISGYTGSDLKGNIGRISGMDPAGPLFEGRDESVRLNPSDAKFVDVIHSNAKPVVDGGAGLFAPSGHVDFYPNGGKTQPGCPSLISGIWDKIRKFQFTGAGNVASCSHSRSHNLYIESISQQGCPFLGHPCSRWEDYIAEYAARGSFFLKTKGYEKAAAPPGERFCGYTYDIIVSPSAGSKNIKGNIDIDIKGTKSSYKTPFQGKDDELSGDAKIVILDDQPLGDLTEISLTYTRNEGVVFFGWGSGIDRFDLDHVIIADESKQYKFCAPKPVRVMTGKPVKISLC